MVALISNISALRAQSSLRRWGLSSQSSTKRLSSGKRINSAADDVAGLSMTSKMGAQLRSLDQVTRNITSGISFAQTAEGGLREIQSILVRAQELATQAASDSNNNQDRQLLDFEFQQLLEEITRITRITETVDGQTPLTGIVPGFPTIEEFFPHPGATLNNQTSGLVPFGYVPGGTSSIALQIDSMPMDDDFQIFTRSGKHIAGTPLTDGVWTSNAITTAADMESSVLTSSNGFYNDATYDDSELVTSGTSLVDGMTVTYSGEQQPANNLEDLTISNISEPLLLFVVGTGQFHITADWEGLPSSGANIHTTEFGANSNPLLRIEAVAADLGSLQLRSTGVSTNDKAQAVLDALAYSISRVSQYRAAFGGSLNALNIQSGRVKMQRHALSQSRMQILDTDIAETTSELARSEITKNLSSSVLAQSRHLQEVALKLITQV